MDNFQKNDDILDTNKINYNDNKKIFTPRVVPFKVYVTQDKLMYLDIETYKIIKRYCDKCGITLFADKFENTEYINKKCYFKVTKEIVEKIQSLDLNPKLEAIYFTLIKYNDLNNYKCYDNNKNYINGDYQDEDINEIYFDNYIENNDNIKKL